MSAHTPRPWKFYEENNYGGSVELGSTNCTVGLDRCDRFTGELVISRDEMRANGHLIEAAPDLLAAAKNAVDYCCGNPETRASDEPCSSCGPLIAAIAKAEARS